MSLPSLPLAVLKIYGRNSESGPSNEREWNLTAGFAGSKPPREADARSSGIL